MASTNKTTYYELSQYVGSDKPTYLVDYNQDMGKIDTGIHDAQGKANTNEANIGTLSNLTTTDKTSLVGAVNEVNTKSSTNTTSIGTLSSLTTSEKTNLVGAVNEVNTKANTNTTSIGTLTNLSTTEKSNLVGAINEVNSIAGIPTGSITMYAGSQAPAGYLLCNGNAVSRTTYSDLFSVIGTTYGAGDGETSFNLPDLRGRTPIGVGSSDNNEHVFTLGATGGEYEHVLTIDELARHQHGLTQGYVQTGSTGGFALTDFTGASGDTEQVGQDLGHNTVQPYLALNYIIKF